MVKKVVPVPLRGRRRPGGAKSPVQKPQIASGCQMANGVAADQTS